MPSGINRRTFVSGLSATAGLAATRPAWAEGPLKVGFVYVGPVGDFGWSYQHEQARLAVQAKLGDKIATSVVESVPEGPDCERVFRHLASGGAGLIYATSFGYMNFALRIAKEFPAVKFEQATGYKTAANLADYNGRFHEARTVCGVLAAHATKTKVVGYVGSFQVPEVIMGVNAFTVAARKIDPDIRVKIIWVNSWFDPGKESDAAKSLIDQGADIICTHTDSPAVMQTAEARGVFSFGQDSDMLQFGPKAQLSAIVDDWSSYYIERTQAVLDGTWTSGKVWYGLKQGTVRLAPYGPGVTETARNAADTVKAGIVAGTLDPFEGPIRDTKGEIRIAAGAHPTDDEIYKMDWFTEGVQA